MRKDRKANRLQCYDYSRNALYFVTFCVQDKVRCLAEIIEEKMFLNEYGKIAEQQLNWLDQQYEYIELHSFVVMPNHIHLIIEIDDELVGVGTGRDLSLRTPEPERETQQKHNEPSLIKIKSLSELMGAYKTTSSKQIHLSGLPNFKCQRSFHDHIIRNEESFLRISDYIQKNPSQWKNDKFYNQ